MSPRLIFEQELENLTSNVREMGEQIEIVYNKLFFALEKRDRDSMKAIIENDRLINDMQRNIEAKCLTLLTRQQPVARDLRMVSASLKVVTDIERVGDQVSDMSELLMRMGMPKLSEFSESLPKMVQDTKKILTESIEAFVDRNMEDARDVIAFDDVIDDYFNQVKVDLIQDLKDGKKNPDDVIDALMIAKYLEKIGDHATNISEWATFKETGNIDDIRLL